MASVRTDPPLPDPDAAARLAAFKADLAWMQHRQAEAVPVSESEYDRIEALQRESVELGGAHAIAWWKTVLGCFGDVCEVFEESRRSIGRDRAAEARGYVRRY